MLTECLQLSLRPNPATKCQLKMSKKFVAEKKMILFWILRTIYALRVIALNYIFNCQSLDSYRE